MRPLLWDNHVCLPLDEDRSFLWDELERHRLAGTSVVGVNIGYGNRTWDQHLSMAERFKNWIRNNKDRYRLATSVEDLKSAAQEPQLSIFFDVEGGSLLEGDPNRVRILKELGVGWMCLTYNTSNSLVGGCLPGAIDDGLTNKGRDVLRAMTEQGIIACCSHTGHRSALDIIEFCDHPVIFSHSNCASVYGHWRNIPDALIIACAEKGGVIGLNGVGPFLGSGAANSEILLDHLDHVVQLVGPEHASIALDYVYDGEEMANAVLSDPSLFADDLKADGAFSFVPPEDIPTIASGMRKRGYSVEAIDNILGRNLLRVADSVWRGGAV